MSPRPSYTDPSFFDGSQFMEDPKFNAVGLARVVSMRSVLECFGQALMREPMPLFKVIINSQMS